MSKDTRNMSDHQDDRMETEDASYDTVTAESIPSIVGSSSGVLSSFISIVESLVEAVCEVFPECKASEETLSDFRLLVKPFPQMHQVMIAKWHETMSPYYDAVRRRDASALFTANISILQKMHFKDKWNDPDFDEQSRQYLYEYIDKLNSFAQVYMGVPSQMMGRIDQTAQALVQSLTDGSFNPATLDIQALSQSVLAGIPEEELAAFAANIPQLAAAVGSMGNMGDMSSFGNLANMFNFGNLAANTQ